MKKRTAFLNFLLMSFAFCAITDADAGLLDKAKKIASQAKAKAKKAGSKAKAKAKQVASKAKESASKEAKKAKEAISNEATKAKNTVVNAGKSAKNKVVEKYGEVRDAGKDSAQKLGNAVGIKVGSGGNETATTEEEKTVAPEETKTAETTENTDATETPKVTTEPVVESKPATGNSTEPISNQQPAENSTETGSSQQTAGNSADSAQESEKSVEQTSVEEEENSEQTVEEIIENAEKEADDVLKKTEEVSSYSQDVVAKVEKILESLSADNVEKTLMISELTVEDVPYLVERLVALAKEGLKKIIIALQSQNISPEAALMLINGLDEQHQLLSGITISGVPLGDDGVIALSAHLENFPGLKYLILSDLGLTGAGAVSVLNVLAQISQKTEDGTYLKLIDFSKNKITSEYLTVINESLKSIKGSSDLCLKMNDNPISGPVQNSDLNIYIGDGNNKNA